jgi:hypothetical protein
MANERPKESATVNLSAEKITLDQLISSASTSVLRALKEHEAGDNRILVNPKIWCGIWVDLERFRNLGGAGGPLGGPGGGPTGGGGNL